ncbi:MAG: archaeosine synthase subunit alpha [Thermoplasmata archaeon]
MDRDGLARTGVLEIDDVEHATPAIAFVDTPKHPAPPRTLKLKSIWHSERGCLVVAPSGFAAEAARQEIKAHLWPGFRGSQYAEAADRSELSVLNGISTMLLDSKKFADAVAGMKQGADLLRPAYCPVAGLPHRLAFLAYCGFDVFDSIPLIMATENDSYLTCSGVFTYERMKELPCSCPSCSSGRRSREELLRHNCAVAENELKLVRHAISEGRLRELVEARIRPDPWLVQGLRLLDLEHYDLQEMHTPVKGSPFHAGSKESLSRPDVVRWRKRLESRYAKPRSAKVLLLIPCSAKKPYSISQSHLRFRQALLASGKHDVVHEVIVTSPLGLVPRDLELFYPAQDYDIPVTGHWDRDEKNMVEEMVQWLVRSQNYDLIISHLGDEREPVNSVLEDFVDTSGGNPGSRDSIRKLEETLRERAPEAERQSSRARDLDDMRSLCRFQFGATGESLCDDAHIVGRWPNLRIVRGTTQLGMLTGHRGMVSLTMDGAKVLAMTGAYCVEIDDFVPKGNLFAVGVEGADKDIRIGDDVAVVCKKEVRAVGVARMCAAELELAERGEAVHIRHSL